MLLSPTEVTRFVNAVKELKRSGLYDWYVRVHIDFTRMPPAGMLNVPHMGPGFYPWHRQYLHQFEQDLKEAHFLLDTTNNKREDIDLPFWNWARSFSADPALNRLWKNDFLGPSGTAGPPTNAKVVGGPFETDNPPGNWRLIHQDTALPDPMAASSAAPAVNYLQRALGANPSATSLPTLTHTQGLVNDPPNPAPPPATLERPYDANPWSSSTALTADQSFRNLGEGWVGPQSPGLHNRVHVWIWGSMFSMASPNDPVFYLHHANVDRLWVLWQLKFGPAGRDQYPAKLPAGPATLTAAPGSGGALGAGTYGYEVAAVIAGGAHTARSPEAQVTIPSGPATVNLTWAAVAGATGYLVYRRTSTDGYSLYAVRGAVTTFPDIGAAGPAPPPVARPSSQPRLGHAFDDPMPPWDGRPDTRPPTLGPRPNLPVVRAKDMLNHRSLGYRYRDVAVSVSVGP